MDPATAPPADPTPARPSGRRRAGAALGVVALAALVMVSGAALVMLAASPRPGLRTSGGRIALVDAAGALRTVDAAGRDERRYALPGGRFQFPAWAPDGRHLAAVGVAEGTGGLYVLDDAAPRVSVLPAPLYESAAEPPFYLYWAPDGGQLTFLTSEAGGLALRAAPADGSGPASVVRRGSPMYWDWAGDDRLFVHAGGDGPDAYVGEVRLDGGEASRSIIMPGRFQAPAVSRDGRRRAYVAATDPPAAAIVVEDGRDGSIRRLAVLGTTALGWAPVTGRLAFIAPRGPRAYPIGPLDVLDPASTQPRRLLDEDVVAFFWSRDGQVIAALSLGSEQPREVASRVPLPDRTAPATAAPPGAVLRLVVLEAESGASRLERSVRLSDAFVRQLLPYFDQYALSHGLWSPDGEALVLPIVGDDDRTRVSIVPLDGGEPRSIVEGEIGFWGP